MRVGILRESVRIHDARVALTPGAVALLTQQYPSLEIDVQPSAARVFSDEDFRKAGALINEDLTNCDVLFGIKEVAADLLIPGKTYFYFAHVAKQQHYHKEYLKALLSHKINLVDYEYIKNASGHRLTAFGYWAGIVGVYNALRAVGLNNKSFNLPSTEVVNSYDEMMQLLQQVKLPNIKLIITGNGLTAKGVIDTLDKLAIKSIEHEEAERNFTSPVYLQLKQKDYLREKNGKDFNQEEYYQNPEHYESVFNRYVPYFDVYLPCHFWAPNYPSYLTTQDLRTPNNRMKIIADISCDINGPIASSIKETRLNDPYYDYNCKTGAIEAPFSSEKNVHMMTVGNLPAALPHEASESFAKALVEHIFPALLKNEQSEVITNATVLKDGALMPQFSYLYNFLNSK